MKKDSKLTCSYATRLKLANALKELMENESFDRISISDITNHSRLHRQTFYYHFNDKYELLNWILHEEIINPLIDDFSLDDIYRRFINLFTTMLNSQKFYTNASRVNIEELSKYISHIAYEQMLEIIMNVQRDRDIGDEICREDNILFAEFLGYGIVGIVYGWVQRGMKDSPEEMSKRIENVVNYCKKTFVDKAALE